MRNEFDIITKKYISPTLIMYTKWIVSEAERLGIKRLYFLARDGYQMYRIAKRLSSDIECSYFYCSRYALRMAAYRFFDDCAYERLFIPAFKLTARNMLERADFDENERAKVYDEIGFNKSETAVMGRSEFAVFCEHIRNSVAFSDILKDKSDKAYALASGYIMQEGMQSCDKIGIVDLGWTGSLQYTLRRLLDSMGIKARLYGFYMGMLDEPPKAGNSEYHTWLFGKGDYMTRAWFAHNLMECICSAPHGMTKGYKKDGSRIVPILAENENGRNIPERISNITLWYAGKKDISPDRKAALYLLRRLMFSPTRSEAHALSVYNFCDDVGEQYHRSIVQNADKKQFRRELFFHKALDRDNADGLYWYCGSAAASDLLIKPFYRYGYLITRYLISKLR